MRNYTTGLLALCATIGCSGDGKSDLEELRDECVEACSNYVGFIDRCGFELGASSDGYCETQCDEEAEQTDVGGCEDKYAALIDCRGSLSWADAECTEDVMDSKIAACAEKLTAWAECIAAKDPGEDDTGSGTDSGGSDDTLPDLLGGAEDPGGCEEVLGEEVAGAASMFFGEYSLVDDTWTGEERWLIYANETWRAAGGEDCEVVWSAEAFETDPPACSGCDLGLQATLVLNEGATTCDLDIVGGADGAVAYGIDRRSDGSATWYFTTSMDVMGDGQHIDTAVNFLTDPSCRWW
jgi:hypothetical protein